jgi:uncharacterized membrane protein YeiH
VNSAQGLDALLTVVELAGVFVFAISGGLLAADRRLDLVGVLILGGATGLGGGVVRDLLIGAVPPAAVADWRYLAASVAAGLAAFWFHPALGRMERLINVFDAAGLGLFCVTGASKALDFGVHPVAAALLGMVTGVGGGMIRDILAGRIPVILVPGQLYAIPALAGASIAVAGWVMDVPTATAAVPAAVLCTGWRLLAMQRGWLGPTPKQRS